MQHLLLSVAACLLFTVGVSAQAPTELANDRTAAIQRSLDLDAERTAQVGAINLRYMEALDRLQQDPATARASRVQAAADARKVMEEELRAVLSPSEFEQYRKLDSARANAR